jgi:hypothetical protein
MRIVIDGLGSTFLTQRVLVHRQQGAPMRKTFILATVMCIVFAATAQAQLDRDRAAHLTRSAIQAERQAIIAANLDLDEKESAVFWPLYQEYRDALESIIDTRVDLLDQFFASYETLTDDEALALLDQHLDWEKDVLKVRTAYAKKMRKVLSGRTVAKFFQIENKMDLIIEYELAGEIPLIK